MAYQVTIRLPDDAPRLRLPEAIQRRLQYLLDRQDRGEALTQDERLEAEGIVDMAELLSLLRLRAEQAGPEPGK